MSGTLTIGNETIFTHSDSTGMAYGSGIPVGSIVQTRFISAEVQSQNANSSTLTKFHNVSNSNNFPHYVLIDNLTVGNAVALHFCVAIHIEGSSSIANGGLGIFRDTTEIYETDTDAFQNYQGTSSSGAKFSTLANILFIDTNFSSTSHTYYLGGRMGTGDFIRVEANVPSTFLAQEIKQ